MKTNLPIFQRRVSQALFFNTPGQPKLEWTKYTYEEAIAIDDYMKEYNEKQWHEAYKINNASYRRKNRLAKRIGNIIKYGQLKGYYAIFCTLTFNDKMLEDTTRQTRRRYVSRFFDSQSCFDYVANIDFGGDFGREHYHAIVLVDHKIKAEDWYKIAKNSFAFFNVVKDYKDSDIRLAKYISKITNHAIKETTKQCRLIYKKNPKLLVK